MKKEYLLVDGYNIIFAWEDLKKMCEHSLEDARDKLISILSNYQGAKGIELIIVFDAHMVKGNRGSIEKIGKTYIVYTKEAETADNYIERITKELVKDCIVKVATSDRLEQIIILGSGAIRVSATELRQDIRYMAKKVSRKIEEIKPIKNNMLFDNLDPKTAEWFEKMRQDKNC
ncbi:NYN domain-containing protein [[Clostridium] colinum]|uniref:NYN domain-containing protein n=1 Tax=[Clostridium] colinum TaxID=36835 RepID=UPI002023DBC5|nr:NYN domain-containing protein [[Clostridium] colinum]